MKYIEQEKINLNAPFHPSFLSLPLKNAQPRVQGVVGRGWMLTK
jgi:hypothetical protein